MTLRTMVGWVAGRRSEKDSATHRCIGRSSANFRGFFRKMPTDTGRFDEVLALFAPDAVMVVDDETLEGRDAIAALFERTRRRVVASGTPDRGAHLRHFTATHQIDVLDVDRAVGRCYFQVLMAH